MFLHNVQALFLMVVTVVRIMWWIFITVFPSLSFHNSPIMYPSHSSKDKTSSELHTQNIVSTRVINFCKLFKTLLLRRYPAHFLLDLV